MQRRTLIILLCASVIFLAILIFSVIFALNKNSGTTQTSSINALPTVSTQQNTTSTAQTATIKQQLEQQSVSDDNFNKSQDLFISQYPWYNSLPLQTDSYFVYFDPNLKKFEGVIYDSGNADSIKAGVNQKLKDLGIDVSQYPIEWSTQ